MFVNGDIITSPGGHFCYLTIGPVCQLYDREELPWPCCRLQWKGKEPSWNRIGRRFVPDISVNKRASYAVILLDKNGEPDSEIKIITYWVPLELADKEEWYSKPTPANQIQWETLAA